MPALPSIIHSGDQERPFQCPLELMWSLAVQSLRVCRERWSCTVAEEPPMQSSALGQRGFRFDKSCP